MTVIWGYCIRPNGQILATNADAGNETLEPVVVSIGPQYGTAGPFRPLGAMGTRWSALLLAWECGTGLCVADSKREHHA